MKSVFHAFLSVFLPVAFWLSVTFQAALPGEAASSGASSGTARTELSASVSRVPMDHRSGHPVVEVLVNGEGPFNFLIDTCASGHARIDRSLVARFGLRVTGTVLAGDGTGRNNREVEVVHIDSLSLGSASFSEIDALAGDYRQDRDGRGPVLGILCFDLFADYLLTIDYPGGTVSIEQGALRASGPHTVPFTAMNQIPAINLDLAGLRFKADVDTGSRGGLMVPLSAREALPLLSGPVAAGTAETRFNKVALSRAPLDGDLTIAGHTIVQPSVYFADLFDQVNLGYEILRRYALTFDRKNLRVRFRPEGNQADFLAPSPPAKTELPWNPVYQPMDMAAGKPIIEAGVNGEGPFRFVLDTATPFTILDQGFANELGLVPADSPGSEPRTVNVENLSIGSAVFGGVEARLGDVPLTDSGGDPLGDPPVGVLGFHLFSDCLLTLDYPEKRIIVERGQLLFPDGKEVVDLIIKGEAPFALIRLGPIDLETRLDSGSDEGLLVPGKIADSTTKQPAEAVIGGHSIREPEVDFDPDLPCAVAGSRFLRSFSLTFDQKNRRLRIAQPH